MGELFIMAGIITAIILCFVGIVKLPFVKFKTNKPKLYKATFTVLSIVLSVGACLLTQFYIFKDTNITNYIVLQISVIAGVFGLYSSYEGLGLKALVNTLIAKLKEYFSKAPENKFTKYVDKIGLDKAIVIMETILTNKTEELENQNTPQQGEIIEQQPIITVVGVGEETTAEPVVEVKDIRDDRPLI